MSRIDFWDFASTWAMIQSRSSAIRENRDNKTVLSDAPKPIEHDRLGITASSHPLQSRVPCRELDFAPHQRSRWAASSRRVRVEHWVHVIPAV